MFYFGNIIIYFINLVFLCYYFRNKMNLISIIIILFNLQLSLFFIYLNYDSFYGIALLLASIIMDKFISLLNKHDEEIILIQDGNINFHNLIKYYSIDKLFRYLKRHHLNLDKIAYCIKKNNQLIIIKCINEHSLPISLILDGEIKEENLKFLQKDATWLKKELLKNNLLVKNINYAYFRNNQIYYIM